MTGTDKQIKWAEDIRRQALATLTADGLLTGLVANDPSHAETLIALKALFKPGDHAGNRAKLDEQAREARTRLESITEASWWINHRVTSPSDPDGALRWWGLANSL